ncbi:MAG: hypothetical protein ABJG68_13725 [Crocinitomicaceae bacterium]
MASKKLNFSIMIPATNAAIWKALWSDQGYRAWAEIFFEGSYIIADNFKKGSTVHFLSPDKSGIYSIIEQHEPNKSIVFKHIGNVKNGEAQALDEDSKNWTGSEEKYSLSNTEKGVKLQVDIDVLTEHLDFMQKTFPEALDVIKKMAIEAP